MDKTPILSSLARNRGQSVIARSILIFFFVMGWCVVALAQTQLPMNSADIKQGLDRLNTLGSVLYFAAHPDDENTRLIAWLAKEKKYRTAYLSLTRGDGGQNLIGTEQAAELGLIRTEELLAARRIDGGEQYFSRLNDFGFSKTAEETLRIWDEEQALADAVWVIRKFRPDVIITRFPPDERGGHGHHQASGQLAIAAFSAAADPARFPEQLKHTTVWQAKRLLWNTSPWARSTASPDELFELNIGDFNPLIGQSYGEVAAESRSAHKSQGFGAARQRGDIAESFEMLAGDLPQHSLMDGVDVSWQRIAGAEHIHTLAEQIAESFDFVQPERSVPDLLLLLEAVEALDASYWREQKIAEIKELVLACAGIWFESYASAPLFAQGEELTIKSSFIVRRPGIDVVLQRINSPQEVQAFQKSRQLPFNELLEEEVTIRPMETTQPYWLAQAGTLGLYTVTNPLDIGQPGNRDNPSTSITLAINGKSIRFERSIVYKYTDPVRGEVYEPLAVVPPVTATLNKKSMVFNGDAPSTVDVVFVNHTRRAVEADVLIDLPAGWQADVDRLSLVFDRPGAELTQRITVYPGKSNVDDRLALTLSIAGEPQAAQGIRRMTYEHIPPITWFPEAQATLHRVETGVSATRIGYIAGAGDLVAQSLRDIGLQVDVLGEADILGRDLSQYDAIVTGVRLYNVNPRMRHLQPVLLDYVAAGGTLVMQYNVNGGLVVDELGPYSLRLSRGRVTEEDAAVRFLEPNSRVLNYPNTITDADFEGWVQERGLYFVESADGRYEQPLSMNDTGEGPLSGSLLVTKHGEGNFVYTSLSFFRQLPAGVPGAYRLFVNLLAKPN